jgi:hypothetical protein
VAVQPIGGTIGPSLRAQLSRLLQRRGFRVLTSVPAASGTSQYPEMARENRLAAFLVADLTEHGKSATVTFLVWNGSDGSVIDRWSVWAPDKKLGSAVAKGFWPHLGKALCQAEAPPRQHLGPGPTLHIDASDPVDEPIMSDRDFVRPAGTPVLR